MAHFDLIRKKINKTISLKTAIITLIMSDGYHVGFVLHYDKATTTNSMIGKKKIRH